MAPLTVGIPIYIEIAKDIWDAPCAAPQGTIDVSIPASGKEESVPVHLGGELLSTGQLELACTEAGQAGASGRKYRLEFQLRDAPRATSMPPPPASLVPARLSVGASPTSRAPVAPSRLGEAERIIDRVFGKKNEADPRETKDVLRELEKILGDRVTWTYDRTNQLLSERRNRAHADRHTFTYDAAANRRTFADGTDLTTYTYDAAGQLTGERLSGLLEIYSAT